jgi:putative exonuclease SbcCD C subunit/AAA domain-containing protein
MNTRSISLTQLHAINWYGYADSIPVSGNLLLAGVTGSGKSILMDLLQFVLIGDRRLVKFNQSATGERSDRDLKGYVLGDLKEEIGGVKQYMRQSAVTYVALEFTWPDGQQVETWGMRIEFTSAAEQHGRITPWWCKGRLNRGDFLTTLSDGKRLPRELADWESLLTARGGETFHGIEEYLRDMSSPGHLNFDQSILSRLLPTAMSFTFLKSFNEFCRLFILPPDRLDVGDVTASYRTFRRYEKDLAELRLQLDSLRKIRTFHDSHGGFERDAAICQYLKAEALRKNAEAVRADLEPKLKELRSAAAVETKRLEELDAAIPLRRDAIKELERGIGESPDGKIYLHLKSENVALAAQIASLRETGTTLQDALATRVRAARTWAIEVAKLPFNLDTTVIEQAASLAESDGLPQAQQRLRSLCDAGNQLSAEISRAGRPNADRLAELRKELGPLREESSALKLGRLPFPTFLLDALNASLPAKGGAAAAQHLCQLCEVKDERWRAAIEVAFTRKFAIVVESGNYDRAETIYHELRGGQSRERESLVNPRKALKLARPVAPGSLAEKIDPRHPVAAALIAHLFGDLMCCERREQFGDHDAAILPDGFASNGAFVERVRNYDNLPFVGRRGLEQQLAWKEQLIDEREREERKLAPLEKMIADVQRDARTQFEAPVSFYQQLASVAQLDALRLRLESNETQLDGIDRSQFDSLEERRQAFDLELKLWEKEHRGLLQSQKGKDLARAEKEMEVATEEATRRKNEFLEISGRYDYSACLPRLEELRKETMEQYLSLSLAAQQFERRATEWRREADVTRERLIAERKLFLKDFPKFDTLPVEASENTAFDRVLSKIERAEIPTYEQKSKDERAKWDHLFRTQVLEKLRAALVEVKNIISLLNTSLNRPIGNSLYFIQHQVNPDYRDYHNMLDATAVAGTALFSSVSDQQLRDSIDRFLETLSETPDGIEAARLLDYRHYYEYKMFVEDTTEPEPQRRKIDVDQQSGKFSGGEIQAPYFIAILASYLRAYRRHSRYQDSPTLALVPIDEAFSKLSGERISDCITALSQLDLQGALSMSTGNIPYAFELCDHLLVVSKEERRVGRKLRVRNVAVSIARESDEGRRFAQSFA